MPIFHSKQPANPDWIPKPESPVVPWRELAFFSAYLGATAFFLGIFAPCFTIIPKFGEGLSDSIIKAWIGEQGTPISFSILGGIKHLLKNGEIAIGVVLLVFSVLFPIAKLAAVFTLLYVPTASAIKKIKLLESAGKWSMLDVLVIAVIVVGFKAFPGGTSFRAEWGLYLFACSVFLGMLATFFLRAFHKSDQK